VPDPAREAPWTALGTMDAVRRTLQWSGDVRRREFLLANVNK